MKLSTFLILALSVLASTHPVIIEHTEIPNRRIQTHDDPIHALHPRDSLTVDIKSTFSNITVSNTKNIAKLEMVNNAKNANIAMGDHSNHIADFHSFGDKDMLNSADSNTGRWNTKNRESNLTTPRREKRDQRIIVPGGREEVKRFAHYRNVGVKQTKEGYRNEGNVPMRALIEKAIQVEEVQPTLTKRDQVNLDQVGGNAKNSNTVEVYVAGGGDDIVNITVGFGADNSAREDSENNNIVKFYIGDTEGFDRDILPVLGVGGNKLYGAANIGLL